MASLNWGPYLHDEAKTAEEINKKKVNTQDYGNWGFNLSYVLTSEEDLGLQRCDAVSWGECLPTFRRTAFSLF